MANFLNPVPQGAAGTGAAFILPKSEALDDYVNNVALQQHQAEVDKANSIKQQQLINKSYNDNAVKVIPGQLFGSEVNGLLQQHIEQGAKYRQQGFDIYNPDPSKPDQVAASTKYMQDRVTLEQLMQYRKDLEANTYNKEIGNLNDPLKADKYDPESVDKFKRYFQSNPDNNRLQNMFFGKEQAPTLQAGFNQTDFLKDVVAKPTTVVTNDGFNKKTVVAADRPGIQTQIEAGLQSNPAAQRMLIKNGVDIGVLKGTKDKTQVMKELDAYYQTPAGKAELTKSEIPYGSDEYWKGLPLQAANRIQQSVENYHKVVDKMVDVKAGQVESKTDSDKDYRGLNYTLALHNSGRADEMLRLAKDKFARDKAKGTADSKILDDPSFGTLKMSETNNDIVGKNGDGAEIRTESPNPTYNYSTYSTVWQPVKGEGVALDVPNYKHIDLSGHLVESREGGISRLRLAQVGNLPVLPSGSYANDATLDKLSKQMKAYSTAHPDATRMSISSGGSIPIPQDKSQINASWFSKQLSHKSVAVLYDDHAIKKGQLASNAKPILIPVDQIMPKIKANKIAVPQDDFLDLGSKTTETDEFGL